MYAEAVLVGSVVLLLVAARLGTRGNILMSLYCWAWAIGLTWWGWVTISTAEDAGMAWPFQALFGVGIWLLAAKAFEGGVEYWKSLAKLAGKQE